MRFKYNAPHNFNLHLDVFISYFSWNTVSTVFIKLRTAYIRTRCTSLSLQRKKRESIFYSCIPIKCKDPIFPLFLFHFLYGILFYSRRVLHISSNYCPPTSWTTFKVIIVSFVNPKVHIFHQIIFLYDFINAHFGLLLGT